jgi:hypothetical protein
MLQLATTWNANFFLCVEKQWSPGIVEIVDEKMSFRSPFFFFHGLTAVVGLHLLILEVFVSHSDTPHSIGLLCTSDRPNDVTTT